MSAYLFKITRFISVITVLISLISSSEFNFYNRDLMLLTSLVLFLTTSYIYEYKWGLFGPGYVIYFLVIFIIHNVSPYNYVFNYSSYYTYISNRMARLPNDNYIVYFTVFVLVSVIIIAYLLLGRRRASKPIQKKDLTNIKEAQTILIIMCSLLIPLAVFVGGIFKTIFIPATSYFIITFIFLKHTKRSIIHILGFIISLLIIATQITSRYVIVRYMLPIIFAIILFDYINNGYNTKLKLKSKLIMINGFISILLYGVFSEIIKLNSKKGIGLETGTIFQVFRELDVLSKWIDRQSYRIFEIWTLLGGNIIDYANSNGYFYGVTYIKSLSSLFGFEYISLPSLSASMVGANYAQPGLLAEGYANFGVIGALLNILIIFFLAEYFSGKFLSKPNMFSLLLVVTPFSSIILDGGTLNAALFNIIFLLITFISSWLLETRKRHGYI